MQLVTGREDIRVSPAPLVSMEARHQAEGSSATSHGTHHAALVGKARYLLRLTTVRARVAQKRADSYARRRRHLEIAVSFAGLLGFGLLLASPILDIVDGRFVWPVTVVGLLCMTAPLGLVLPTAMGRSSTSNQAWNLTASQGQMLASMADTLTVAIEKHVSRPGIESLRTEWADDMLRLLERRTVQMMNNGQLETETGALRRKHERIVPQHRRVTVRTSDGRLLVGTIANVSVSGVALTTQLPRVSVGQSVTVGSQPARVSRLWDQGIAFEFDMPLDLSTFDDQIVL